MSALGDPGSADAPGDDLLALIDALADGGWHSGERLAAGAGISRAALAKRIDRVRELGLDVDARHGLGYRLGQPLERLDAQRLQLGLPGVAVQLRAVTDSTNRDAAASPVAADPQLFLAEFQRAGRGRRGRQWQSPFAANLYFTLSYRFAGWPPRLSVLPLVVGVEICRLLESLGVRSMQLKWPNDLYHRGRKLGGILIEQNGIAGEHCRLIIGIGLNIAMHERQAEAVDQPWTSLHRAQRDSGASLSRRTDVALQLAQSLLTRLDGFVGEAPERIVAEFEHYDWVRDQPVQISDGGQLRLEGWARGIDPGGALRVDSDSGVQLVHAGDVSLRRGLV